MQEHSRLNDASLWRSNKGFLIGPGGMAGFHVNHFSFWSCLLLCLLWLRSLPFSPFHSFSTCLSASEFSFLRLSVCRHLSVLASAFLRVSLFFSDSSTFLSFSASTNGEQIVERETTEKQRTGLSREQLCS